jgi:molybdopterin-guanine dinucleotide biosynthesis protein A
MNITAYITAGGNSRRFKEDKSLYSYCGKALIQNVYDTLSGFFPQVSIIANEYAKYGFLTADVIPDLVQGFGPLGGLYSALVHTRSERIFFCGCDMPHLSHGLINYLVGLSAGYDVVVPVVPKGYEPVHAVYSKQCVPFIENSIDSGNKKITAFYHRVRVREVSVDEMQQFGDWEKMLFNINYRHEAALSVCDG